MNSTLQERDIEFYFSTRQDADLTNVEKTQKLFEKVKPTFVIHLAALVGGLFANMADKVGFLEKNLAINHNVISSSYKVGVKRLVCVLSTCVYPDKVESYPI